MTRELIFRSEAELDLEDALRWYDQFDDDLPDQFLGALDDVLDEVQLYPRMYPVVDLDIRKAPLNRFPYGIFYIVYEDEIAVIGIVHDRRDPEVWMARR